MIQLTLHIERLLLHNDCVIVPGLGGFVAQNCSARYVEEEDLFLPPYKSVSFNQRLTMNDGLLVSDVARYHDIDYKAALLLIQNEVNSIIRTIASGKEFVFHGIGHLYSNDGQKIEFQPIDCGISSPDVYGLDSFYASPITKSKKETNKLDVRMQDDDTLTFRVGMNYIRYAAVAAVAAVFFFICIAPLNSAIQQERSEAGMLHWISSLFDNNSNKQSKNSSIAPANTTTEKASETKALIYPEEKSFASVEEPQASISEETAPIQETLHEESVATPSVELEAKDITPYAIVVASQVSEKNAQALVDRWKEKGLDKAIIYDNGKFLRVFYGSYISYEKAHEELTRLRAEYRTEFTDAWVYEVK